MAMDNPKVIKKGDRVITNYVDEKTGKIAAYEVGIKLEVSDFSGQWFPAKIVEVDKGEQEVLVHFENWSARFDEWIKMDSNRLRPSPNTNIVKTQFKIGESVEALWNTDGQRYPGVIQNILPNDYYQVLFDDGIKLKKKYNQIFKLKPATRKSGSASAPSTQGPSNSKVVVNTEPVGPNPTLPTLTPFTQLVSPVVEPSQSQGTKVNSLQPPPLTPKPTSQPKKATGNKATPKPKPKPSESLPPLPVPEVPVVKKVQRRRRKVPVPLPATPPPPILATPPAIPAVDDVALAVTPDNDAETPMPIVGAEEPLSSKRKRTVQDYSALLRIRRRFPYQKDVAGEVMVKRTRRSKNSPVSEPPELFRERSLSPSASIPPPVLSPQKEPTSVDTPPPPESQNVSLDLPPSEKEVEADVPAIFPLSAPPALPIKPKLKRRGFRPFNTTRRRRSKKSLPIKYVVVDDEEFAATRGVGKLNKTAPSSAPTTPGRVSLDGDLDTVSGRSTPTSAAGDPLIGGTPDGSQPETRIIKRRRRRTYATLQMIADTALATPTSPNGEEPLSKRKRTIHDYSMLLKTRPKFFFDIDAERERSLVQPARKRRSTERSTGIDSLSPMLPPAASPASGDMSLSIGPVGDETEGGQVSLQEPVLGLALTHMESSKKSEPSGSNNTDGGPTSIATHRPVRRSSSQFARKSYVSPERVSQRQSPQSQYLEANDILAMTKNFSIVVPEPHVLSSRLSESGSLKGSSLTLLLEPVDGDYKPKLEHSTSRPLAVPSGRRRGSSSQGDRRKESERKPQLGSRLTELDYTNNSDEEELLDIGYGTTKINSSSSIDHVAPKPRKSPVTTATNSSSSQSAFPSQPANQLTSPVKEVVRRKSRLGNSRWWKRKPQGIRRVRMPENGETLQGTTKGTPTVPRSRKILQKIKRRPGDLLSGLTLKRIKTIRSNLYRQGFRKRILAEPALKDVSVDIISCVCGSTDEHGLMVQCEYCQCWQHGQCFEIENVTDMPKNYVCEACLYPDNVRWKRPSDFQYDFHKVGKLPRFAFGPAVNPKTTKLFQESNTLIQRLYQVREIIQTSRVHMNIMETKPDHPKLYQWDKPHETIRETQQEQKFNKVYRPLLRRLLFYNQDDPQYISKLRTRVETVVKKRSLEEKQRAEKRLSEKFPASFPPPRKVPVIPKRVEPSPKPVPPVKEDKEAKRLEAEALRIRKELESRGNAKPGVPVRSEGQNVAKIKSASEVKALLEITKAKYRKKIQEREADDQKEVRAVMDSMLEILEAIPISAGSDNSPLLEESRDISPPVTVTDTVTVTDVARTELQKPMTTELQKSVTKPVFIPVDLGEEAPPEFPDFPETDLLPPPAVVTSSGLTETESSPPLPTTGQVDTTTSDALSGTCMEPKLDQEFNAVDLMNLDPSDPKFTTIAEDLVKSCCEEPESLIKTLEDLANGTSGGGTEGGQDLEGNDSDLFNFLDDAFMDTFVVPPLNTPNCSSLSGFMDSKLMLPPPPPPPPIPSSSTFILPPAPPKLTRLTPELCRGNLILTILDQQRIIDQYLDEIETRVVELEKIRGSDVGSRAGALRRISLLQTKVKKMMKGFEVMKSIGKKAEHSLHELIRFDPSVLDDGGSGSEREEEELNNEETDSVEEEDEDEDLSEDELEDL